MKYATALVALSISAAAIISTYAGFTDFVVKGKSMEPAIAAGDKVACDQTTFINFSPGDIVIYQHPKRAGDLSIKTIVAVGGQSVAMRRGRLSINGRAVDRKAAAHGHETETLPNGRQIRTISASDSSSASEFAKVKVAAGHVFVMGNNRDHSIDSRSASAHGSVPVANIVCRASLPTKRG